jgi:hypothetical protein
MILFNFNNNNNNNKNLKIKPKVSDQLFLLISANLTNLQIFFYSILLVNYSRAKLESTTVCDYCEQTTRRKILIGCYNVTTQTLSRNALQCFYFSLFCAWIIKEHSCAMLNRMNPTLRWLEICIYSIISIILFTILYLLYIYLLDYIIC